MPITENECAPRKAVGCAHGKKSVGIFMGSSSQQQVPNIPWAGATGITDCRARGWARGAVDGPLNLCDRQMHLKCLETASAHNKPYLFSVKKVNGNMNAFLKP